MPLILSFGIGFKYMSPELEATLSRIDEVLRNNRRTEWIYISLSGILFLSGIGCIISAILTGDYIWSTPSAATTLLLKYPLGEVKEIRQKNIALATAPVLISQLPSDKAAEQIQKLLQQLYGEK